jgi:hypothetical protein
MLFSTWLSAWRADYPMWHWLAINFGQKPATIVAIE